MTETQAPAIAEREAIADRVQAAWDSCPTGLPPIVFTEAEASHLLLALLPAQPQSAVEPEPLAGIAARVGELVEDGAGFWRSCSGCYESEDGYPVGHYPHSAALGCPLGGGCSECGGIGAVWDNTDWSDFAEWSIRRDRTREAVIAAMKERLMVIQGKILGFSSAADDIMALDEPDPPAAGEDMRVLRPISEAPKDATWIVGWFKRGWTVVPIPIHWAEDLSGSEQPPFRGWFRDCGGSGFAGVALTDFIGWEPISEEAARRALTTTEKEG